MLSLKSSCLVGRRLGLVLALTSLAAWSVASAQTITTLASFNSTTGDNPLAGLIADGNGNLYGSTVTGGLSGQGTAFELVYDKTTGTYGSTPSTLFSFDISHGSQPKAGLIADGNGNLFGTTYAGGNGYGTVFEIPYNASTNSYASTPTVLVNFDWNHGAYPDASLITDSKGNLFGTTYGGGSSNYGTVFEVPYDSTTATYASAPVVLVNFDGSNGRRPEAGLLADGSGNLFGTTFQGGSGGLGTVFELPYDTATGLYDNPIVLLADFAGSNGEYPEGGLIADGNRNLFGTTVMGGGNGVGTVFEIPYSASTATYGDLVTLVNFDGSNGSQPEASLIVDSVGNLFGTSSSGGVNGRGTVFELPYSASTSSYASAPTILINFDGNNNGAVPVSDLIADNTGNLYGTTYTGGYYSAGTAFEVTNSGFVPPLHFAGTPGQTNCVGVSNSTLAHTYGGVSHAAASLGYPSVAALQSAVSSYCGQ